MGGRSQGWGSKSRLCSKENSESFVTDWRKLYDYIWIFCFVLILLSDQALLNAGNFPKHTQYLCSPLQATCPTISNTSNVFWIFRFSRAVKHGAYDSTLLLAESLQPCAFNSASECPTANLKLFGRYLFFKL